MDKSLYKDALNLRSKNKHNEAIELLIKCVSINNNSKYLMELAENYELIKDYNKAINSYYNVLKIENTNLNILNKIGVCYFNLQNYNMAIKHFEKILLYTNPIPDLLNNIGFCYGKIKDYINSIKYYLDSCKLKQDKGNYRILGDLFFYVKNYNESIKYYNLAEQNPIILYNKSFAYLAQKQYKIGLELYENRFYNNYCHQTKLNARVDIPGIEFWDGIKECSRLLVVYEQGIGDNIQYYRFIIELSNKYPNMIIDYFCRDTVAHLFNNYNNINIIDNVIIPLYNYKLYIMSLPKILNITDKIEPNDVDYININKEKLNYWNEKLSTFKKYKVGIVYNGLLSSFIDKNIPLKYFKKLLELNVDLICLHKKEEQTDNININYFDIDKDKPFEDTICILKNIDLLITIDTSIVHLAGVMNINTWLLLGYGSDWRWSNTDDCYWYKSVQLIRMKENKDLYHIIDIVYDKLKKLLI